MKKKQSLTNGIQKKKQQPNSFTRGNWFYEYFLSYKSPFLLAIFQIAFLITIIAEGIRIYINIPIQYLGREIYFKMFLFSWLPILPSYLLYLLPVFLIIFSLAAIVGYLQKIALFFILIFYSYFFVIEISYYNNHYYLIILINFLLLILPGNRPGLIDFFRKKRVYNKVPNWYYQLLKGLLILVYFSGGLVKLNHDWLSGNTMAFAFAESVVYAEERSLLSNPILPIIYSWLGLIFDLSIGFLLLYKRTRLFGIIILFAFHLLNAFTLDIGIFPWFMMMAIVVFIDPENFDKFLLKWNLLPMFSANNVVIKKQLTYFICFFIIVQLFLPIRHHFINGNVDWTGEGSFFAWRMKAASRKLTHFEIFMYDKKSGKELKPIIHLKPSQIRAIYRAPVYLFQVRDYLLKKQNLKKEDTKMYIKINLSMNGHVSKPLIISNVDLCSIEFKYFTHNDFITLDCE